MSTKISWTNDTWNPVSGCSHVSEGCRNCYAETLSLRYGYTHAPWTVQNAAKNVVLHRDRLMKPLHWKKPRRVFVNSMSDLFHELVPDRFIIDTFAVMALAQEHTFQILTKRPARMMRLLGQLDFQEGVGAMVKRTAEMEGYCTDEMATYPLPNVWLGVSCEDQGTADERIPLLLQTPAAIRFLSCEPLLGKIRLLPFFWHNQGFGYRRDEHDSIDWVIAGGESGPHFRKMDLDWARSLRDQCVDAKVPFFFKQESAFRSETNPTLDGVEWHQFPNQ